MRRYLSLYFHFFRNCLIRDLEFRFNVLIWTFIATFPTQALLGQAGLEKLLIAVVLAGLTFLFSEWFWRFALKHYQSASS